MIAQNEKDPNAPVAQTLQPAPAVSRTPQKRGGVASPLQGGMLTHTAANVPKNPVDPGMELHPTGAATPLPAAQPLTPMPAQGLGPGAAGTATDPNNALTTQTLARAPGADRFQLAQDRFQTFTQQTDPAYQAALRDANRMGAAAGGLGSGQLRTSFGNLANQRANQLDTGRDTFMQNALEGTIADSFGDVGIAQQQQGFQNQQQQQAFQNELARLGFDDSMANSAFGRALQTFMAGQTGGTGANTSLAVGNQLTGQGNDALGTLNNLIKQQSATTPGIGTPPFNPNAGIPQPQVFPWMGGGVNG